MSYFQIENWDRNFETPESRKIKTLHWVAMQNSFDGKMYKRLLKQPEPMRVFGVASLMAELASRAPFGHRGKIIGSDLSTGYTHEDMADKTGMPIEDFIFAIPILISIGWVSFRDENGRLSKIPDNFLLHNITGHGTTEQPEKNLPAAAAFFERIIALNYQGTTRDQLLSDFRSMPRLSNYDPSAEGTPEAMLYVLESIPAIQRRYPKFKIYAFLQKAVNEKFPLLSLAGAMKSLIDLKHAPQDMAPYWQALIRKPDVLRKCWEESIWPSIKHGKYKLQ